MRLIFLAAAWLGTCGLTAAAADMPLKAKKPAPVAASPFWIEADYLLWTVKGDKLPALVSTGTLGVPGTGVLFGDAAVNDRWRSGGQIKAGYWFDPQHSWGIEGSFFGLQDVSTEVSAASNGSPPLARPFFNCLDRRAGRGVRGACGRQQRADCDQRNLSPAGGRLCTAQGDLH
jgi:hypothetical protein